MFKKTSNKDTFYEMDKTDRKRKNEKGKRSSIFSMQKGAPSNLTPLNLYIYATEVNINIVNQNSAVLSPRFQQILLSSKPEMVNSAL